MEDRSLYVYALVEGQTEAAFVKHILEPHLAHRGVWISARLVQTSTKPGGRGGMSTYARVRGDLVKLIAEHAHRRNTWFTTMFDLYRLPQDFPGHATRPQRDPYLECAHLEQCFAQDIADLTTRFVPYLQIHEFEALVLVDPEPLSILYCDAPNLTATMDAIHRALAMYESPEEINHGPNTAPSKGLRGWFAGYNKVNDGVDAIADVGLGAVRAACPHFNAWLDRLEALPAGSP